MQGKLYQLLDPDGEQVGIILSGSEVHSMALSFDFEKEWREFYAGSEVPCPDADAFVDHLHGKYPHYVFERVFTEEASA